MRTKRSIYYTIKKVELKVNVWYHAAMIDSKERIIPILTDFSTLSRDPSEREIPLCYELLTNKSTGEYRQYVSNHLLDITQNFKKHGHDGSWGSVPIEQKSTCVLREGNADFYTFSINDYNIKRHEKDINDDVIFIYSGWFNRIILSSLKFSISAINPSQIKKGTEIKLTRQRTNVTVTVNNPDHVDQNKLTCVYYNDKIDSAITLSTGAVGFLEFSQKFPRENMKDKTLQKLQIPLNSDSFFEGTERE